MKVVDANNSTPINRQLKINRVVIHLSVWYFRRTLSGGGEELCISWLFVSIVKTPNGQ